MRSPTSFEDYGVDETAQVQNVDREVLREAKPGEGMVLLRDEFDYQVGKRRRDLAEAFVEAGCKGNVKALVAIFQMAKPEEKQGLVKTVIQGIRLQMGSGSSVRFEALGNGKDEDIRDVELERSPDEAS